MQADVISQPDGSSGDCCIFLTSKIFVPSLFTLNLGLAELTAADEAFEDEGREEDAGSEDACFETTFEETADETLFTAFDEDDLALPDEEDLFVHADGISKEKHKKTDINSLKIRRKFCSLL
jgi:hypothetical protein